MIKKNNLENNRQDLIAALGKSVVGVIPFAGPLLSELIGAVIPNQRVDRLTKYIKLLEDKMSQIPEEIIDKLKTDENFIDLVEEGFVQASRSITDERRKYIVSVLVNGITDNSIELEESKSLLKILQELNDVEIIWLRSYHVTAIGGDENFRKKHDNVLSPITAYVGADKETFQKAAIQDSYKKHLERLGLIKNHIRIDSKTKMPEFDRFTGQPKVSYSDITQLGEMLLEQIGMSGENE